MDIDEDKYEVRRVERELNVQSNERTSYKGNSQVLSQYVMSIFKIPVSVCRVIEPKTTNILVEEPKLQNKNTPKEVGSA